MTLFALCGGSMLVWTMSGRMTPLPSSAPTPSTLPLSPLEPAASNRLDRREALAAGVLASVAALAPQPAHAQRSALIPKSR